MRIDRLVPTAKAGREMLVFREGVCCQIGDGGGTERECSDTAARLECLLPCAQPASRRVGPEPKPEASW